MKSIHFFKEGCIKKFHFDCKNNQTSPEVNTQRNIALGGDYENNEYAISILHICISVLVHSPNKLYERLRYPCELYFY